MRMVNGLNYSEFCRIWDNMDWKEINYHVRKLQQRIAAAAYDGDWKRVRRLQKLVFVSWDCRAFAVHRVTCRRAVRTAGLDGLFWYSDFSRFHALEELKNYHDYKPMPFKRIYIPKDHDRSKKRPLSVPVIYDRAMQALYLIACDPVVECTAGEHDYGFRMYRSSQDVIRDIVSHFGFESGRIYFLKSDVKQCFDHLSHDWILEHSPMNRKLLKRVLKCGYCWNGKFHETNEGVPQGGVLSPCMTSLCLNGFERVMYPKFGDDACMVRFVDDFLFSGTSPDVLEGVKNELIAFLAERGLSISEDKTIIGSIYDGVDYIGWHIQRDENGLQLSPTQMSIDELTHRLEVVFHEGRKYTARKLIRKLNGMIRGWSNYHGYLCAPHYLADIDNMLQDMVWEWALQKHPRRKPKWIYLHHWKYQPETKRREFSSDDMWLLHFTDIKVKMKRTLDLSKNPYLDLEYFRRMDDVVTEPLNKNRD